MKLSPKTRQRLRKLQLPRWVWRAAGLAGVSMIHGWWSTLHYRGAYYDLTVDPVSDDYVGPAIYIFWHEYIPMPIYLRPNCRLSMLLSPHQDAEIVSHIADFAGMGTVRGSSFKRGSAALIQLVQSGHGINLAITPDGPRGPRRKLAPGCVYLSSRLQVPIVGLGIGYDRPWRLRRTWDQFAIPRPFSRCRLIMGPRIQIPPDIGRADLERYRLQVEQTLNTITETAERWAAGEIEIAGAKTLYRASPQQPNFTRPVSRPGDVPSKPPLQLRKAS